MKEKIKKENRRFPLGRWLLLFLCLALALAAAGCRKNPADAPLTVTGAFPADGAGKVPEDTAIEVTFSVPPEKLDDYFAIQPEVKGSFRYLGNTAAFVPFHGWDQESETWCEGLTCETRYTVTLKAGLGAQGGKGKLAEDYSFSFTVCPEDTAGYEMSNKMETFLPQDYPVLDLRSTAWGDKEGIAPEESYAVTVHRLEDGERYKRELYREASLPGGLRVDTAGLPQVLDFTQSAAELLDEEDRFRVDIVFPQTLEEGWYVATVVPSVQPEWPVQKLLQIQESAVYKQTGYGEAVLWYNSTKTGAPVKNPRLEVYKDPFGKSEPDLTVTGDENGITVLELSRIGAPEEAEEAGTNEVVYALFGEDGTVYYDRIYAYGSERELNLPQQYYGFLYTDRPIYRREDTIKYWGVARPRKDAEKLSQVQVELYHGWNDLPFLTQTVAVSPDGVFTGEFTYEGIAGSSVSVKVFPVGYEREEGGWHSPICSEYADIAQYKKPIYTAAISSDKLYYRPGETIRAQVEVSLMDRTPAAGMTMRLAAQGYDETEYTTDEKGLIQAPFTASAAGSYGGWGWYPQSFYISGVNGDASDVDLSVAETVYVFPTTLMLEAEETRQNGKSDLVITANQIDFDKIPGGRQVIQDYGTLRGAPAQANVKVDLHKVTFTRTDLAPYYDRYTKKSIPRAVYTRGDTVEKTFTQRTGADGTLTIPDILPPTEGMDYYYAEISTADGGEQRTTLTLGNPWIYVQDEERKGHFHTFQMKTSLTSTEERKWISYWGATFAYGDEARYQVMDNGLPVESGTVMTNLLQQTLLEAPKLGGASGTISCTEEKLPNFTLCGAYFDGVRIYPIKPFTMDVDPDSRSLKLQVLPDKEDYKPGDTAKVTLRLTDEDGKAVPGGSVCLGVVDEAIFAVREQYINMGYDLYGSVFYAYPQVSASYIQHGANIYYDDGGKGGGGGDGGVTIRENFKDTADFLTGVTGADGAVTLTVKLPENLTQWRLTAVALDKRAYWGFAKSRLYTTLPFRIDPILSDTFLSGDTIACTVRGFGTGIGTADQVSYTASIDGYTEKLETEAQAPAGVTTPLVFRKLPAGEYTMTVTARCGEYSDGVRVPFSVRDSALVFPIHQVVDLKDGLGAIRPTLYPVEIQVYNKGQEPFMQAWSLLCQDNSGRGDARLATAAVEKAMSAFFGEGYEHPEQDLTDVQLTWEDNSEDTGGVRLYSYAEADAIVSGRAAVAAGELLNQDTLASYLDTAYTNASGDEERAAALMGLAALGRLSGEEETLLRTRAQNTALPVRESAYLIAGLHYLDQSAAQKLYSQTIAPKLQDQRGTLYVKGNTPYETVDNTAGALACAILTGAADDAEKMMGYLAENGITLYGTMVGPCQLEAALYINHFQLKEEDLPAISYTKNGKRESVTLTGSSSLRFVLDKAEFEALDMKAEGGTALASVYYTGTPDQLGLADSSRIAVTKTMDTPEDQKHLGGETTVTIKVELDKNMPYGSYRLVEWIPSNMRLRSLDQDSGRSYSCRSEGQLLTVDFAYSRWNPNRTFTFRYTAASVLDTECCLERTYVYNQETMECGRTEKGEFLPSDYYYLGVGYLFRKE